MKKSFVLLVLAVLMFCSAILAGGCQYADVNDRVAATPASGPGDVPNPNGSDTGNEWYNIENQW